MLQVKYNILQKRIQRMAPLFFNNIKGIGVHYIFKLWEVAY